MKNREIYAVSVILIVVGICVVGWFFLRDHPAEPLPGHQKATQKRKYKGGIAKNSQAPQLEQKLDENRDEDTLTIYQKMARRGKRSMMAMYSEEELATPEMQKLLEAMDSPEYVEYFKDRPSSRRWDNFLESKGIPVDREIYNETFRGLFPTGEVEDYEPEMRRKLAEMFLAAEPVDLTDPAAAARQRGKVILEFARKDQQNMAWYMTQFQNEDWEWVAEQEGEGVERNAAREWVSDVQHNAASIVAGGEATGAPGTDANTSASSWDLSSAMESAPASHSETEVPTTPDTSGGVLMTDAEIEAAIEKSLIPQPPDIPSEIQSNLENNLKAQFSSERFERAMSTLEQYGPEEGLRRLKENDPEVAKQVEKARHHNRQEDAQ